jgi:hypothetical protein
MPNVSSHQSRTRQRWGCVTQAFQRARGSRCRRVACPPSAVPARRSSYRYTSVHALHHSSYMSVISLIVEDLRQPVQPGDRPHDSRVLRYGYGAGTLLYLRYHIAYRLQYS